jgi:hypothetical protein
VGSWLHRAAAGPEQAAAQGGARGIPLTVAPRVRGGRGESAGRSPLKQKQCSKSEQGGLMSDDTEAAAEGPRTVALAIPGTKHVLTL